MIAYITAQCNSTKQLKPSDIIRFNWDNEPVEQIMTNEEIERLKQKANQTLKLL